MAAFLFMSKRPWLYEYENGQAFGPASEESIKLYLAAMKRGVPYFNYPYFGYTKKLLVKFGAVEPIKTKELLLCADCGFGPIPENAPTPSHSCKRGKGSQPNG